MKKITCFLVLLLLILIMFLTNDLVRGTEMNASINNQYDKGYRYNIQGWIYLHIEGDPYERGYQHGYLLAYEIIDQIQRWQHIYPQKWSWKVQKFNAMRFFWKKYPYEYKQEIIGIAKGVSDRGGKIDGSSVSYKDILTLNEIYELGTINRNFFIHPIKDTLYYFFKKLKTSSYFSDDFGGKCSAFIATGDATKDGRIVAAHSTRGMTNERLWWHNYVTQRWNLLLDIKPSNGNRILMSTSPGLIWSDEDFYQNDAGIILMETTHKPPGPWSRIGDPIVVRARKAIQYSNSITEVVDYLLKRNNGLMANDWVMGDTKTGEIASLELALYKHALTKTKNGFLWSANNPKDKRVIWEIHSIFGFGFFSRTPILDGLIVRNLNFEPSKRDIKFEEFSKEFYGEIDVEIAKKIMSTNPISFEMFDCKITDSNLVNNFGIWAFMGYVDGTDFIASEYQLDRKTPGYTDMPTCGWIQLFARASSSNYISNEQIDINKDEMNGRILWEFEVENGEFGNAIYSSPIKEGEVLYTTSWNGNISAIDLIGNNLLWEEKIGWSSSSSPLLVKDTIYVGSSNGLYALNKKTGKVLWVKEIGTVSSKPSFYGNKVFCCFTDGRVCSFNSENGNLEWSYKIDEEIYCSPVINNEILYFGSNDGYLYAIYIKDKNLKWKFKTDGPIVSSSIIVNDIMYFGSWDSNLYAIDVKSGKLKWKFTTGWGIDSSPAFFNRTIYVGSEDNNFYAINADNGNLKWVFTTKGGIQSSPTIYGGFIFFGSSDGKMYALNTSNGNLEWNIAPDYYIEGIYNFKTRPIVSSPLLNEGKVYIGSTNGKIYCFDAGTYEKPNDINEKIKTPIDTWLFLFISLLLVIFITGIYLYWSRRKNT